MSTLNETAYNFPKIFIFFWKSTEINGMEPLFKKMAQW